MKSILAIACLVLVACASSAEARPKRSVVYAAAAPVAVAHTVPVAAAVVHSNPTTVVKTEQVHDGVQSSYSYSTEVKSAAPVVRTAAVAAAPVAAVSTVHHTVPVAAAHYGYYPASYAYASYPYAHYAYASPYSYVVGK